MIRHAGRVEVVGDGLVLVLVGWRVQVWRRRGRVGDVRVLQTRLIRLLLLLLLLLVWIVVRVAVVVPPALGLVGLYSEHSVNTAPSVRDEDLHLGSET